jgi:hypothetical protein
MVRLHLKYGNRWTTIAKELGGRTDNDVKNRFYKISKKCREENVESLIVLLEGEMYGDSIQAVNESEKQIEEFQKFLPLPNYEAFNFPPIGTFNFRF